MKYFNLLLILGLVTSDAIYDRKVLAEVSSGAKELNVLVQLKPLKLKSVNSNSASNTEVLQLQQQLKEHQKESNVLKLIQQLNSKGSISYYKPYFISNTIAVTATKEVLDNLVKQSNNEIVEISSNQPFRVDLPQPQLRQTQANWDGKQPHWSLTFINATNLPQVVLDNASKLVYANADTGVEYTHPAINKNYRGNLGNNKYDHNYNWWDANKVKQPSQGLGPCGVNSKVPCDDNDHGTHTMSTTISNLNLGVSPTTKWIACKNMDQNLGTPETYLGCLQFLMAPTDLDGNNPKPELRPHVIGNSYGCPTSEGCSRNTFNQALIALKSAGIFMSVSAGNDGAQGCSSMLSPPAIDPNAFSVASSNYKAYTRSSFSSLGPVKERANAIDVTAPGSSITGAVRGNTYASLSGTSMASPHVSGAALLVMAACPNLERNVDLVAKVLRQSATVQYSKLKCGGDSTTKVPNNEFGYGIINVAKALQLCKTIS